MTVTLYEWTPFLVPKSYGNVRDDVTQIVVDWVSQSIKWSVTSVKKNVFSRDLQTRSFNTSRPAYSGFAEEEEEQLFFDR